MNVCALISCSYLPRGSSAPPQPPAPQSAPEAAPSDVEEEKTVSASGGGESEAEKVSGSCCKVKTPRWIRACTHLRFPASIDPFTSENPEYLPPPSVLLFT